MNSGPRAVNPKLFVNDRALVNRCGLRALKRMLSPEASRSYEAVLKMRKSLSKRLQDVFTWKEDKQFGQYIMKLQCETYVRLEPKNSMRQTLTLILQLAELTYPSRSVSAQLFITHARHFNVIVNAIEQRV